MFNEYITGNGDKRRDANVYLLPEHSEILHLVTDNKLGNLRETGLRQHNGQLYCRHALNSTDRDRYDRIEGALKTTLPRVSR